MRWSAIVSHPFFDLPPERSRLHLRWARILALVLGVVSLVTAMPMLSLAESASQRTAAIALFAHALLYLVLGPRVGLGDVRASGLLLGLAVVKALVSRSGYVLLPIVELWIFTQSLRGAVALSPRSSAAPPSDLSIDVGEWFGNGRRVVNEAYERAPKRPLIDVLVGGLLLLSGYRGSSRSAASCPAQTWSASVSRSWSWR